MPSAAAVVAMNGISGGGVVYAIAMLLLGVVSIGVLVWVVVDMIRWRRR